MPNNALKPATSINPPRMRTFTRIPQGPRMYRNPSIPRLGAGPMEPPPGFVTPTTSKTEWVVYWALSKIFGNPPNPRQGPWQGGLPDWGYQEYAMGGRSQVGGAVVDFMVFGAPMGVPIGIRIGTEWFHFGAPPGKQASDRQQFALLSRSMNLVDLNDFTFLRDPSGEAAVIKLKQIIGLIRDVDPILSGGVLRNRGI